MRRLAKHRAGLDAEEARWLRRAEEQKIWRALGYVHALEYLEEVFGYAPRTAQEKLRVARELGDLPALEAELDAGNMPYSIVRALTRIATPDTEMSWIDKARGRNFRQVEQMLSGHKKGDEPTDAPDPMLVEHDVTWRLDAATRALLRETRRNLEDELGHAIDDATFVDTLCRRAIDGAGADGAGADAAGADGAGADAAGTDGAGTDGAGTDGAGTDGGHARSGMSRPGVMIHLTTCRNCKASVQHGAGVPIALSKEQFARAACDAIMVDDENGKRASSTIPPATRRYVLERDGYRCRFPGCRSTRNLEAHHVNHRANGGDHSTGNVATQCGGHHKLHHDGVISISGDADGELVFTRKGIVIRGEVDRRLALSQARPTTGGAPTDRESADTSGDGAARYRQIERNTLAKTALQQAGFKS